MRHGRTCCVAPIKHLYLLWGYDKLTEGKVTDLKNLMETLQLTLDQAMNALKIPMEEREMFEKMIRD